MFKSDGYYNPKVAPLNNQKDTEERLGERGR